MKKGVLSCLLFSLILLSCKRSTTDDGANNWSEYLGGPDRNHYSQLSQINAENVGQLPVAWQYHTTDSGQIQCNPIIINGVLYGMTASAQPFAVDAATGKEIWRKQKQGNDPASSSRGLVFWQNGSDKRILYTNGSWLYAVDAGSGKPVNAFGHSGRTSLKTGLGPTAENKMVISNTPGTVYGDLIIMPMRLSEGADAALGHIQAFNIRTGKMAWVFHTIPYPGEAGYETWPADTYKNTTVGAANNWSGMSVDRARGIVFVPTGSAAFDFYGGEREGTNLYANCLLALDAKTGKLKWHYQLVHHDILDRDPPAPPNLITVNHKGKKIDAVAQVTKQGVVFVFNRETGEPLFPIQERPMPASDIPGEHSWPTQPMPIRPAPYARQTLTASDINPFSKYKDSLTVILSKTRSEGPFTPLSRQGSVVYPGLDGGAEWGGAAVDPQGVIYINSNEMAWLISLNEAMSDEQLAALAPGKRLYVSNCASCHGPERKGNIASGFPALDAIGTKKTRAYVTEIIAHGKGMMPAFTRFNDKEKQALVSFLFGDERVEPGLAQNSKLPAEKGGIAKPNFKISGYTKFLDKDGYPAVKPPWGTLNAIDLNTGEYVWKIPFGSYPELEAKGMKQTGSESYGGPVVTASGLLFIAGTKDKLFKVYDKKSGKLLWQTQLPAAAFATPATYAVNGKQYVVIACGGTKLGAEKGDSYVAFALP